MATKKNSKAPAKRPATDIPMANIQSSRPSRRAVIVDGTRTPFAKSFGEYTKLSTFDLANRAVEGLLKQSELDPKEIDEVIWGGVVLPAGTPNIARELVLDLKLPNTIPGFTVTRACASGLQAITSAVSAIERGDADVIICGGSDSTSNAEVTLPNKVVHALAPYALGGKGIKPADVLGILAQLMPLNEIIPSMPKVAERSTGEVMGQSAERMAKRNGISRQDQDELTFRSHQRAAAAYESGRFEKEITPVEVAPGKWVHTDTLLRASTTVEALGKLRPVFAKDGTLTAGNSTALTDGGAAVLIMSEEKARALGYTPRAAVRSWDYCAVDPRDQLLMGPAISIPRALQKAGLTMQSVGLVDIHEAFAAQVLSVLKMMDSKAFCQERLGLSQAVGIPDIDKFNVRGGSLALGHPFAATGARIVTTMANELVLSDKETAVIGICAAGGIGAAAVLERV